MNYGESRYPQNGENLEEWRAFPGVANLPKVLQECIEDSSRGESWTLPIGLQFFICSFQSFVTSFATATCTWVFFVNIACFMHTDNGAFVKLLTGWRFQKTAFLHLHVDKGVRFLCPFMIKGCALWLLISHHFFTVTVISLPDDLAHFSQLLRYFSKHTLRNPYLKKKQPIYIWT